MALVNFTLPFGNTLPIQPWTTISPLQRHATAINNMLYDPAGHQQQHHTRNSDPQQQQHQPDDTFDYYDEYKNDPYAPPSQHQTLPLPLPQQSQVYGQRNIEYIPPPPAHQRNYQQHQQQQQHQPEQHSQPQQRSLESRGPHNLYLPQKFSPNHQQQQQPQRTKTQQQQHVPQLQPPILQAPQQPHFYNQYAGGSIINHNDADQRVTYTQTPTHVELQPPATATETTASVTRGGGPSRGAPIVSHVDGDGVEHEGDVSAAVYPAQVPTYTRVQAGSGAKTQVHAVLDYDDDADGDGDGEGDYAETPDGNDGRTYQMPTVTPIQGPIFLKNGSVPVVPLFSYPTLRNGSFVQIPIWWTALSVALGLEVSGDVIRGTPCVKRHHQLFCPTAGNSYPINRIESFIDDNKALMRRMYGDFEMSTKYGPPTTASSTASTKQRKRQTDEFDAEKGGSLPPGVPDLITAFNAESMDDIPSPVVHSTGESYFSKWRSKRQNRNRNGNNNNSSGAGRAANGQNSAGPTPPNEKVTGRLDACESKIEIVTPYWASNSAGKVRAIVNTQHFEQAIHQEVCTKTQTGRCGGDCGCEQKYKWHRLLAYDPDNDCRGIFMDWFLFPSCCVCRCDP